MVNTFKKNKFILISLVIYTVLNLKAVSDVIFNEYGKYWWIIGLTNGGHNISSLGVALALFFNIVANIYIWKNLKD